MLSFIRRFIHLTALTLTLCILPSGGCAQNGPDRQAANAAGAVTFTSEEFLKIPERVSEAMKKPDMPQFTVAKVAPTVDFARHPGLPAAALAGKARWSCFGDIGVAEDGRVYVAVGDHGDDAG